MRLLDQILAWTLVVLAAIHSSFTLIAYHRFTLEPVWFFAAGVAMASQGAFNLLRIRYSGAVPALRQVALAANLVMLGVLLAAAWALRGAWPQNPQLLVLLVAIVGETFFSLRASK